MNTQKPILPHTNIKLTLNTSMMCPLTSGGTVEDCKKDWMAQEATRWDAITSSVARGRARRHSHRSEQLLRDRREDNKTLPLTSMHSLKVVHVQIHNWSQIRSCGKRKVWSNRYSLKKLLRNFSWLDILVQRPDNSREFLRIAPGLTIRSPCVINRPSLVDEPIEQN